MVAQAVQNNRIIESSLTELEKALVLLHLSRAQAGLSVGELSDQMENSGSAKINRTRLRSKMMKDPRCVKAGKGFRIPASANVKMDELSSEFAGPTRPQVLSEFLDSGVFATSPIYIKEVAAQINITYQEACFDACSVMVRRLVETLIIETFENQRCLDEIRDPQGNLVMLKALIEQLKATKSFTVGRQTKNALPGLKDIGGWSAHNRRHVARKSDLDHQQDKLRLATSDLIFVAGCTVLSLIHI